MKKETRRSFVKKSVLSAAGLPMASTALSYSRIVGANERINVAMTGVRKRGKVLTGTVTRIKDINIAAICDVASDILKERLQQVAGVQKSKPLGEKDFRKIVENKDIDVVFISSPDHTHATFAIWAMQGDKHVYLEKPVSHNPLEGDLLVEAQKKYGKVVQVGTQQRSAPTSIQAVKDIRDGIIGDVYTAKCWYANSRETIGKGKVVPIPDWLDWDLWQGPAPRRAYKDNYVHYDWHWFWHWGTGEVNNNGLHELDICRWALGVDHPTKVLSSGGRFFFDDDWEFYDTQTVTYEYESNKSITWEGHSCNGLRQYERGRGSIIYGNKGSILLDRNGYYAYDPKGQPIKEIKEAERSETTGLVGGGPLVTYHMTNFFNAIRSGEQLNSTLSDINKSTLMCHLGNIAQKLDTALTIDNRTGRIIGNDYAMRMWGREYEPGWEPKID